MRTLLLAILASSLAYANLQLITIGAKTAGTLINFVIQFHGKPSPPLTYEWCDKPITVTVKVPECGCLTATIIRSGPTQNSLGILIKNHVIDPNATFVTLDVKTAGVTIAPGSLTLNIPSGGSVFVPITLTPAPAAGSFVRIAVEIHGKKLGNGVYENCCVEEADLQIPRLVIVGTGTGIYGRIFEDANTNLTLDPRERLLAGIPVAFVPERGERVLTRTTDSGEYFLPVDVGDGVIMGQVSIETPANYRAIRPLPARVQKSRVFSVLDFALIRTDTATPAPGIPVLSATPVALEAADGIGGGSTSAVRYSVPEGMATLRLLREDGVEAGVLRNDYHAGGDYVVVVRSHDLQMGFYTLELVAGAESKQQTVFVAPMESPAPQSAAKQAGVRLLRVQVREER